MEEHLESLGVSTTFVRPVFFMDNFLGFSAPREEDGTLVLCLPLPAGIPLQLIATEDIGTVAAVALTAPDRVEGGSVEIAGDELTGDGMAAAHGERAGLLARYEPLPLDALGEDADLRAMFGWFAEPPAYRADFAATKRLAPSVRDLRAWLAGGR